MVPTIDNFSFEQEAEGLNKTIRLLKREGFVIAAASGAAWIITTLLLSGAILTAALGWWGGSLIRATGWAAAAFGFLAALLLGLWRPVRRLNQKDAILLRIGEVYPKMASDVRSAGQLARAVSTHPFSPILMTAELGMIRAFLESVIPEGQIFPKRRLIPPAVAVILSGAFLAAAYVTVPEILEAGAGSLFTDHRPPMHRQRVSEKAPVVADLSVLLKYPEYLKREDRKLDNVSGGFVAPLGTTVTIGGRSLVNGANQGEIHLPDGGRVPLSLGETEEVRGSFVIGAAGPFFISLGTDRLMVDGPTGNIEVEPDAPPLIRLLRPIGRVEIGEDDELELELEAEDDHGLSHIDMVIRNSSSLEIRKTMVRLADRVRRFKTKYRWAPDSIRRDEDVELEIELEAFDDDTILGPKPGRSESISVRFLTPQSRHKSALEEQGLALDSLIDLLAFRLETPVPDSKPAGKSSGKQADEAFSRYAVVRGRTEDLLAKTAKLIGLLSKDPLTPKRVVDTFVQTRQDLSNQLLFEGRLYEDQTAGDYRNRLGVDKVTCRLIERAIIRVDDLVIEQQMSRVVKTGGALQSSRSELVELLSRYKQSRSESVRRGLLSAIDKMEREMVLLEKNIEQIRGKVGDVFINPSSVLRMDLLGTLAKLRNLLASDDLNGAISLARRMESDLGRLLAGLEEGLLSFRTERFGEGERFTGELLDRVMAIESEQIQLRRETIALKRSCLERLSDMMRGKIDPLVKRQMGRLERMRRIRADLRLTGDPSTAAADGSMKNMLRDLGLALSQGDLDEARQVSEDIRDAFEEAEIDATSRNKPALGSLKNEAGRLIDEINEAFPRPAQLLSDKDIHQAANHAVEQRLILSKTRNLKAWIKKQAEETRFLSSRALDSLSETVKRMSQSVIDLESRQVSQSLEEQSAALDELAGLREDLKRGDEVTPIESRPQVLNGRVDLPSPEEFEVPPEFRDDILEAMRGDLPNQYEEAIKKYYETLVQ